MKKSFLWWNKSVADNIWLLQIGEQIPNPKVIQSLSGLRKQPQYYIL